MHFVARYPGFITSGVEFPSHSLVLGVGGGGGVGYRGAKMLKIRQKSTVGKFQ